MDALGRPHKIEGQVAKWENGRTPADGPPDEVDTFAGWVEADGTEITDPDRIAALEAGITEGAA